MKAVPRRGQVPNLEAARAFLPSDGELVGIGFVEIQRFCFWVRLLDLTDSAPAPRPAALVHFGKKVNEGFARLARTASGAFTPLQIAVMEQVIAGELMPLREVRSAVAAFVDKAAVENVGPPLFEAGEVESFLLGAPFGVGDV